MSERGSALLDAMDEGEDAYFMAVRNGERQPGCAYEAIARAICEHLGLTWEDVNTLEDAADRAAGEWGLPEKEGVDLMSLAARISVLLEAAGVER